MKNKIIKTVCFSLLALSVALCAVFTLPKKDNLKVNALPTITVNSDTYFPIIPYSDLCAYDVSLPQISAIISKDFPLFTTRYLDISNTPTDAYVIESSSLRFILDYSFTPVNVVDNQTLSILSTLQIGVQQTDGLTAQGNHVALSAFDFVLPIYEVNENSPSSVLTFIDQSTLTALTSAYSITISADFVINGDLIENEYIRLSGNSALSQIRVYNHICSYFLDHYSFNDVLYVYIRDIFVDINFDNTFTYETLFFAISSTAFNSYQNDLDVIAYFDSFETTTIEYELNLFQTLIRTVHEFMSTEFLPNVSFYDLLLYVLVIPLVIMLLKMWLGG